MNCALSTLLLPGRWIECVTWSQPRRLVSSTWNMLVYINLCTCTSFPDICLFIARQTISNHVNKIKCVLTWNLSATICQRTCILMAAGNSLSTKLQPMITRAAIEEERWQRRTFFFHNSILWTCILHRLYLGHTVANRNCFCLLGWYLLRPSKVRGRCISHHQCSAPAFTQKSIIIILKYDESWKAFDNFEILWRISKFCVV